MKTDYSNPKIMKAVVKEAKDAGIFDKTNVTSTYDYSFFLRGDYAMTLDMIKREKSYGYKLCQIDFIGGCSLLIKGMKTCKIIDDNKRLLIWYHYKLNLKIEEQKKDVAWSEVNGRPIRFIFKDKKGYIEIIKPLWARTEMKWQNSNKKKN